MSKLITNTIRHTGASSDSLTFNSDGHATVENNLTVDGTSTLTGNVTASGTLTASNFSGRNIVINGAMNIAQRGTSAAATGFQTVDRWKFNGDWPGSAITQAQSDVAAGTTPYEKGFRKAWKVTNVSQSSAGASNFIHIDTKLEAQDIANSGWNYTSASSKITLSFWVKSSVAQTFYGYLYTSDGTEQQYPFSFALSADTWTKVTKTIPGHANLTFNNDTGEGLRITIAQFYGTTYTDSGVTLDAWGAYSGTANLPDNTSTWFTTNAATFELTGVQLEVGDVATEFEHRSYGDELLRCQRYFETSYNPGVTVGSSSNVGGYYECHSSDNGDNVVFSPTYRVTKRAVPTDKFWKDDGTANQWTYSRESGGAGAGVTSFRSSQTHLNGYVDCGASWVPCALHGHWSSEAEL